MKELIAILSISNFWDRTSNLEHFSILEPAPLRHHIPQGDHGSEILWPNRLSTQSNPIIRSATHGFFLRNASRKSTKVLPGCSASAQALFSYGNKNVKGSLQSRCVCVRVGANYPNYKVSPNDSTRQHDFVCVVDRLIHRSSQPVRLFAITNFRSNAYDAESWRSHDFEKIRLGSYQLGKGLTESNVISNVFLEPFLAVGAHHEPYFQCPKTSGQGDLPVAIVDDRTRIRGCVTQIRRMNGERVNQLISFLGEKATKIVSLIP